MQESSPALVGAVCCVGPALWSALVFWLGIQFRKYRGLPFELRRKQAYEEEE